MSIERYTHPSQLIPGRWVVARPYTEFAVCGHRGRIEKVTAKSAMAMPAWGDKAISPYASVMRFPIEDIAFVCDTEWECLQMWAGSRALAEQLERDKNEMLTAWQQERDGQINHLISQWAGPGGTAP